MLPYSLNAFLLNILPFEEGKHLPYVSAYNFKFKQRALGPSVEAASDIWGTVKQQGQLGQGPVSSLLSPDSTLSQGSSGIQQTKKSSVPLLLGNVCFCFHKRERKGEALLESILCL